MCPFLAEEVYQPTAMHIRTCIENIDDLVAD
jgi:hypothetical protein